MELKKLDEKFPWYVHHVGFTGTERGMNAHQLEMLDLVLHMLKIKGARYAHHGDCVGADAQFDTLARMVGYLMYIHPPLDPKARAFCGRKGDIIFPEKPYLARNVDIVVASEILLAGPRTLHEERRSGTWYTVRQARKRERMYFIIKP